MASHKFCRRFAVLVWSLLHSRVSCVEKNEPDGIPPIHAEAGEGRVSDVENTRMCPANEDVNGRWHGSRKVGGEYTLKCAPGFAVHGRGSNQSATLVCPKSLQWPANFWCENIDDCAHLKHGCGPLGVCVDLNRGYDCNCEEGYKRRKSADGEIVCGNVTDELTCGGHTCGAYGICINLQGDQQDFEETGSNSTKHLRSNTSKNLASYRCECSMGFVDNGTTCIRKDCGKLRDDLGIWSGSTTFGGAYTLNCPTDAFVYGRLSEMTFSCPEKGRWPEHPVCVSPAGEAIDAAIVEVRFWTFVTLALSCITCAAIAAGLTLGVATMEPFELKVIENARSEECRSPEEKKHLKTLKSSQKHVSKIVTGGHQLMVTLMLFNTMANEALPIFLDQISPALVSILLSVSVVLIFGEILPSAVCTGPNQHFIAAKCVPFVRCLQMLFYPVAHPVCMLLEKLVPEKDPSVKYTRPELKGLLQLHSAFRSDGVDMVHAFSGETDKSDSEVAPLSSAEMHLINGIMDCEKRPLEYITLDACIFAWSYETPEDIINLMRDGQCPSKSPRVVVVVSIDGAHRQTSSGRPMPSTSQSIRAMIRPRDLCSLGREKFVDICSAYEPLPTVTANMAGTPVSSLQALQELGTHRYAIVVDNDDMVVGAVLKSDVIAFMMCGSYSKEEQPEMKRRTSVSSIPAEAIANRAKNKVWTSNRMALKRSNSTLGGVSHVKQRSQTADYSLLEDHASPMFSASSPTEIRSNITS